MEHMISVSWKMEHLDLQEKVMTIPLDISFR